MLQIERCLSLRASFLPAGGRYKGAHPLGGPRYGPKNKDERCPKKTERWSHTVKASEGPSRTI